MILISVLNGVLYSTVFGNIGAEKLELPITADNAANNKKIQQNYIGLCFFACLDAFMTPSLFQIIQIRHLGQFLYESIQARCILRAPTSSRDGSAAYLS